MPPILRSDSLPIKRLQPSRHGEVYRARDTKLDRDVALKIPPDSFAHDPRRVAHFTREAHVLAALNHPHIAAIYRWEDADGVNALVMELVEGPTLAEKLAQGSRLKSSSSISSTSCAGWYPRQRAETLRELRNDTHA